MKEVPRDSLKIRGKEITPNLIDKVVEYLDPVRGARRMQSRVMMALAGSYIGASMGRRQTSQWATIQKDADSDILLELQKLRDRSRDLVRNNAMATGAVNTTVTNVVGTGLDLHSRLDRDILNMTDDQADAWESRTEREWKLFFESTECDATRILNGHAITELVFRQTLENGDVFINLPRFERGATPYNLRMQVIEADRVCNEKNVPDKIGLAGGIEKSERGEPVAYWIMDQHPGSLLYNLKNRSWTPIPAFGEKTGLRNILHLYKVLRPGQSRGVPFLAPVIESLKQLDRYTEAEIMAAVISSMFTVFIKSSSGDVGFAPMLPTKETGGTTSDEDYKLSAGGIVSLAQNEDVEFADPSRPNSQFDPFFVSIVRQIGVALEIPFEVLIKHFTASYSAARAALLQAWQFFMSRRFWLISTFLKPLYEIWLYEAVAAGRISAPGFFADPLLRMAYSGSQWIGPAQGQIDPTKEVAAAESRLFLALSTRAEETSALTGGDFERNMRQIVKEKKMLDEAGIPWATKTKDPGTGSSPDQATDQASGDVQTGVN